VLRILFLIREVATRGWKLYNKKLQYEHSSSNIIRVIKLRMGWAGHIAYMHVNSILVGKSEDKIPLTLQT
jgi:hypothetical protein